MVTNKEVLQKLLKIARNQQKIITKLAQATDLTATKQNITNEVNVIIGQMRSLPLGTVCVDAQYSDLDKRVDAKVRLAKGQPGESGNQAVIRQIADAVAKAKALKPENVHVTLLFG